jgi:hypothetical protein
MNFFSSKQQFLSLLTYAVTLWPGLSAHAGRLVTFAVTPACVSNTFGGQITLQIGLLNTGETVVVQKFLDANTNGVIDAGDLLVQQFQLTDGQANVIGGVTNINVPGDWNPTNGVITTPLNLQISGFEQQWVGQYAFKLFSPPGLFVPVTNLFNVTNAPYAQSFTGVVRSGGANVPNAIVELLMGSGGNMNPVAGAVADSSGNYTIKAAPGTYTLAAFASNYVCDLTAAAGLTLITNATIATNLNLIPATCDISGQIVDAGNTNVGLPGLFIGWQKNGLMAVGFTDTNGNFNVPVTSGQWKYGHDLQAIDSHGYLGLENKPRVDTSTGSVAGVTIALAPATALIYGIIRDAQGHPLAGVRLFGDEDDNNALYRGDATTDQNGNYAIAANADIWNANIDMDFTTFANYVFSQGLADTNLAAGQALELDFTALLGTNQITGQVRDYTNAPVAVVGVHCDASLNGTNFSQQTDTDGNGCYVLNVVNGIWDVAVSCNGGDSGDTLSQLGYQCVSDQSAVISGQNGEVNFTVYPIGMMALSQPARPSPTQFGFNLYGSAGTNYTIWASTNLSVTNWFTVMIITNLQVTPAYLQDNQATNPQRFYRALPGP